VGRLYLDWNASAPLRSEAKSAMLAAMEVVGNPSSVHAEGRAAKALVEKARAQVAAAVGCLPDEVIFTSGATEAASVLAQVPPECDVLVDPTAHDALWSHVRMQNWRKRPLGPGHTLAMGLANSETGIITEPPAKLEGKWPCGDGARADWLLLDVTQAVGRIPFAFGWSRADMAVVSAHKFGGPKGVGALILRQGIDITPWVTGGGQEMGRRAGTENLIGIAGFGAAAEAAARDLAAGVWDEVAEIRNILESELSAAANETISVGNKLPRLPNTLCLIAPGWKGETQVMAMDLAGFAISAGSACSSGKVRSSRVLTAMGYDDALAGQAIRVSMGPGVTKDDVGRFAKAWTAAYGRARMRAA
jgi:cysteine desulfurase